MTEKHPNNMLSLYLPKLTSFPEILWSVTICLHNYPSNQPDCKCTNCMQVCRSVPSIRHLLMQFCFLPNTSVTLIIHFIKSAENKGLFYTTLLKMFQLQQSYYNEYSTNVYKMNTQSGPIQSSNICGGAKVMRKEPVPHPVVLLWASNSQHTPHIIATALGFSFHVDEWNWLKSRKNVALIQISTTQLALQTDIQKSTCEFSHFSDQAKKNHRERRNKRHGSPPLSFQLSFTNNCFRFHF